MHDNIREQFPLLKRTVHDKQVAYLDNASSSQKSAKVMRAMEAFDKHHYANVHRGVHTLAEEATEAYEGARETVAAFVHAEPEEIIFTSGTTESINTLARSLVQLCKPGDEIVVSLMEHHSNFVPWQQLAQQHNLKLKVIPLTPDYLLDMEKAREMITDNTKIVAVTHISNVTGTIVPIKELATLAHEQGAMLVVDGAQAVPHIPVDVKDLDADFYAFSGHKMYGPTGIGVLYGRKQLLEELSPSLWGGSMVKDVTVEKTTWNDVPWKFEAGTPKITQAVGLAAAIQFIQEIGFEFIQQHEHHLMKHTLERLKTVSHITLIGPPTEAHRTAVFSFVVDGVHPHDVAAHLDQHGVAIRAGHHCAQPLQCALGIDATARVSLGMYNTIDEIDRCVDALATVRESMQ